MIRLICLTEHTSIYKLSAPISLKAATVQRQLYIIGTTKLTQIHSILCLLMTGFLYTHNVTWNAYGIQYTNIINIIHVHATLAPDPSYAPELLGN